MQLKPSSLRSCLLRVRSALDGHFRFSFAELSGGLADLGVLLPLVLALIALNGVAATSTLVVIGLAYLMNAFVYRLPVPVQPLKSLAAVALALSLSPAVITAGAWWLAAIFLVLALTGADRWIGKLFPLPVIRGIQLGLAVMLLRSAWKLVQPFEPLLLAGAGLALIILLGVRREWAAAGLIGIGLAYAVFRDSWPVLSLTPTLPIPTLPDFSQFGTAFWLLAVPQIPLSLANSVYATSDAATQYFGSEAETVTPRRLLTTMSIANIAAAALGGVPVCHGSGGLTAHYKLGARTGGAPLMLGIGFLALGLLGGTTLLPLLAAIPFPVLGLLLGYIGVQHGMLARDLRGVKEWLPALSVALVTWFTRNLAIGFAAGAGLHFAMAAVTTLQAHRRRDIGMYSPFVGK